MSFSLGLPPFWMKLLAMLSLSYSYLALSRVWNLNAYFEHLLWKSPPPPFLPTVRKPLQLWGSGFFLTSISTRFITEDGILKYFAEFRYYYLKQDYLIKTFRGKFWKNLRKILIFFLFSHVQQCNKAPPCWTPEQAVQFHKHYCSAHHYLYHPLIVTGY